MENTYGFQKAVVTPLADLTPVTEDGVKKTVTPQSDNLVPEFELNDFGFPLNDMAALVRAQSLEEYNMIVQRLQHYEAQNPDNSKKSVADILRGIMPREMQTPFEIYRVATQYGSRLQEEINNRVLAAQMKQQESPAPASAPAVTTT